jgi:hypothetical protein
VFVDELTSVTAAELIPYTSIVYVGVPGDPDPDRQMTVEEFALLVEAEFGGPFLALTGGTVTGEVIVSGTQVRLPSAALGASGSINLDFSLSAVRTMGPLSGAVTFTTSNLASGRSVTVRVENGGTIRTLTFPTDWVFVGRKPADIEADKTGVLTVTSFGSDDASCVAAFAVEE